MRERIEDFECEHIEADTIIFYIYSQTRKAGIMDAVVIDAEDTDVVVLSFYVAHKTKGILAISSGTKTLSTAESYVRRTFSDYGKKSMFDKGTKTQEARGVLRGVGNALPVTQEVLHQVALFTICYIYSGKVC